MKWWFLSKTIWVNILTLTTTLLVTLQNTDWIAANPELAGLIGTGIAIVNVLLRLISKTALKLTK